MFLHAAFLMFAGLTQSVSGHYVFGSISVNGTKTSEFQYVREVTRNESLDLYRDPSGSLNFAKLYPHTGNELRSVNFTCGRDAWKYAPKTETAVVLAGSELSFHVSPQMPDSPLYTSNWNGQIFHEGPAHVYMARAGEGVALEDWRGDDGEWFKVKELLGDGKTWETKYKSSINFTIPESTPAGKYLVRVEQFTWWPETQFYLNCAHIEVRGEGKGAPTDSVHFPGAYYWEDVERHRKVANTYWNTSMGPKVWTG